MATPIKIVPKKTALQLHQERQGQVADATVASRNKKYQANAKTFENSDALKTFRANPSKETNDVLRASADYKNYQQQQDAVTKNYRRNLPVADLMAREQGIGSRAQARDDAMMTAAAKQRAAAPPLPVEQTTRQLPVANISQALPAQSKKASTGLPTGPSTAAQNLAETQSQMAKIQKQVSQASPQTAAPVTEMATPAVMAKGGMVKKPAVKKMAKGGAVMKANCGASVPPTQKFKK